MAVRHAFTIEEWHHMGETGLFGEDARLELLDGEVIEMLPIGSPHGGCVNYLTRALVAAARDFAVIAVQNPLTSITDDIATTKRVIDAQKGPVVVVGHSYGGLVMTGAAAGNSNVKALVYIAAFAPEVGE